jgi:molybdopterin-guanine dinucleotide biosynthesis protein B
VDLILTEGYKDAAAPKIEVKRGQAERSLISDPEDLVAVASDRPLGLEVPEFDLDDASGLADFIETRFLDPACPD